MQCMTTVIKIGGSLFDVPGLGAHFMRWRARHAPGPVLLVPGGGAFADAVRAADRHHDLGAATAHWLAWRAVSLSAHLLAALVPDSRVVASMDDAGQCWRQQQTPILDAHAFASGEETGPGRLPASWDVTSDSLAARAASVLAADRLVLLKSTPAPENIDLPEAGRLGIVDSYFSEAARGLNVEIVDFRAWMERP